MYIISLAGVRDGHETVKVTKRNGESKILLYEHADGYRRKTYTFYP